MVVSLLLATLMQAFHESILGLSLFLIYINDLAKTVSNDINIKQKEPQSLSKHKNRL